MKYCLWFVLSIFSISVCAAPVRLVEASLTETLGAFSAITGDTYTTNLQIDETVSFVSEEINTVEDARSALDNILTSLGIQLVKVGPKVFQAVQATGESDENIESQLVNEQPVIRRIDVADKIDRRGLEQLVSIDPRFTGIRVIADGSRNQSVLVSGRESQVQQLVSVLGALAKRDVSEEVKEQPQPVERVPSNAQSLQGRTINDVNDTGRQFAVIDLRYAEATAVVDTLKGLNSLSDGTNGSSSAHGEKNQVILYGEKNWVLSTRDLVEAMDRELRQVYIDAIIAEVSEQTTRQLGLQFSGRSGDVAVGLVSGAAGPNLGTVADSTMLAGVTGGLVALGGAATQFPDLGVLLTALEADGDTRILATPSLMAIENRASEILVGQNVPFVTGQYTADGSSVDSPFQTIQREDLGTILKFKPRVGRDGTLLLEVTQEVSRLDTQTSGLSDLATIKRELSTVVSAQSGETIAIGGLRDEQLEVTESKIPVLGDVPVLGHLFRQESVRSVSRNLVIFLRPTLVNDRTDRIQILHTWHDELGNRFDGSLDGANRVFEDRSAGEQFRNLLPAAPD